MLRAGLQFARSRVTLLILQPGATMKDISIHIDLRLTRGALQGALVAAMMLASAADLSSEKITLSTYYPAPSGVYTQMITTGNTFLSRDGGRVGIGTSTPSSKLHVQGSVRIVDGSQGSGKILTSDLSGNARWQPLPSVTLRQVGCSWTPFGTNTGGYICPVGKYVAGVCTTNTSGGCNPATLGFADRGFSSGGLYCCFP